MALGFGAVRFSAAMTPRSAASLATRIARFDVLIMAQSKLLTIQLRTICPPDPKPPPAAAPAAKFRLRPARTTSTMVALMLRKCNCSSRNTTVKVPVSQMGKLRKSNKELLLNECVLFRFFDHAQSAKNYRTRLARAFEFSNILKTYFALSMYTRPHRDVERFIVIHA